MSNVTRVLAPGTTVAGYRVEALIGRGGMGAVYRAEEVGLGRKVALKVIAPELAQDERFRERFLRESKIAASLEHPHVVPIHGAGEDEDALFLAMRYVEGTDLATLLAAEGPLEPERALSLLSQVAEALDAAHAKGLIHRDVKPSNVLIAEAAGSESCYLADFGLTKRTGSESAISTPAAIVGTLEYIAPEQITGEPLGARADVYSLGCVLYECLTGQVPFPRATDVALLWAHVNEEPPPPSSIRPNLPAELDAVLAKALAKDPRERFASAGELLKACSEPDTIAVASAERGAQTNLPRPLSSFVGREAELAEVRSLIESGARLLTLTGPGGTGKTRLALEAARSLVAAFENGVSWVGLASLRDPTLVTAAIAQSLGARGDLAEHIGERKVLLLLDNLKQVIDAAPELSSLLERCPNLTLLVTSRELLRLQGEVEYPVPPLAEPEAVSLFCERSRLEPSEEIAELCARLDNLPLAVELAAARTKAMSPAQILERLLGHLDLLQGGRDADPRQQTLRATIERSHDLLSEEEQRLFRRLSVFAGGCTLEAAEEICDADLDTLQSLVEKSLIRFANERYWMLETIREYAVQQLEESGQADEFRRLHAEYFLALAEEAEPNLLASRREWLERLEREHDNFRAALDRLEVSGESEHALRLAGALYRFWYQRGRLAEGRRRLESVLRADDRATAARAKALDGATQMALEGGDAATARLRAEQGLALHRQLGDAWGTANSVLLLGNVAAEEGDLARAQQLFDESVRRFRELGDDHNELLATRNLAWACNSLGDRERARALNEDVLRRARALPNERIEAMSLGQLATIAIEEGRVQDALSMLKNSHRINRDLGELYQTASNLARFAHALAVEGRAEVAAVLLSRSEALNKEVGVGVRSVGAKMNAETLANIRAHLDEAAFAEAWEEGQALTVDQVVALALETLD